MKKLFLTRYFDTILLFSPILRYLYFLGVPIRKARYFLAIRTSLVNLKNLKTPSGILCSTLPVCKMSWISFCYFFAFFNICLREHFLALAEAKEALSGVWFSHSKEHICGNLQRETV